jgi:ATP-dependent RNA helicase DeaD
MTKFEELKIKKEIVDALYDLGFKEAFPIQEATIPILLSGRDVVGQAHTGTGKTGAYSISMLQQTEPKKGIQGLIIAPTRELAIQITNEIKKFAKYSKINAVSIYGGQGMEVQLSALRKNVEIIVATPGRLIDHLKRGSITLERVSHVVLDEADTMLDMGFIDDIQFILDLVPEDKVMSLFSATMPTEILRLSEEYLTNPKQFLLDADDLSGEGIDQSYLVIKDREKEKYLIDFIKENNNDQCIVFCSTKIRTRDVARMLHRNNIDAVAIEGDMSQHRREQSMSRFRQAKAQVLVATDVAARGIDVPRVALVVNYDVPTQEMVYFHRIGRTARAGAKGMAITFVSYSSIADFNLIKRKIKVNMRDLNKEMGIEINIPDPLKREVPTRRHGSYQRSGNRSSYNRRSGGGRYRRGGGSRGWGGSNRGDSRDQRTSHSQNRGGSTRRYGGGKSNYNKRNRY